ncbi:vWA domain-containing protein [Bathymodiolus japonicus methanotrophic gill symbiont]|uniref:vWA domain-containing protein n=1 Tax=Bathymodiolus japonicus methanotrophic gill symbiont TaxID=113269 RepID=UPI001C8E74F8|nr:vWA domain-containing protein [Bathymodiolus japonicus methanotrophic gill symbiont]
MEITNINDPTAGNRDVALSGDVIQGKTLDVAMVLDRSFSMNDPVTGGTKSSSLRNASELFIKLMRPDVNDRIALVSYNTESTLIQPRIELNIQNRQTLLDLVNQTPDLNPSGETSIAAGLLTGFNELNDGARDVRAVLLVTDGKDNVSAQTANGSVDLDTVQVPAGIGVHSVALGRAEDVDFVRLTNIANTSGGSSVNTGNLTGLSQFDLEKFFLQAATA